jgi:SPX domain protein involved in polyphosphate accumulation
MKHQMIFKRYELKYKITRAQMEQIKAVMEPHMVPDQYGQSMIQSLYLDTPDYRLIRRSMEHPVYKEKLRLRSYGIAQPDSTVFLELKKKYDSVVYKRRIALPLPEAEQYLRTKVSQRDTQIAREIDRCMHFYPNLSPKVLLTCQREAFYGKDNSEFRVTFDDNILWRDYDLDFSKGSYGMDTLLPDEVLMEIKTEGAIPLWMVKLLTDNRVYKTTFSKYGTAYQMLSTKGDYHYA